MSIQLHPLANDTQCPFCGASVSAGTDTCPSCHAQHGTKPVESVGKTLLLTFAFIGMVAGLAGFVVLYISQGDTTSIYLGSMLLVWLVWSLWIIFTRGFRDERTAVQWWPHED